MELVPRVMKYRRRPCDFAFRLTAAFPPTGSVPTGRIQFFSLPKQAPDGREPLWSIFKFFFWPNNSRPSPVKAEFL